MEQTTYKAGSPPAQENTEPASGAPLPAYMSEVYDWAYINPRHVRLLDRNSAVSVLLFGNAERLMRRYLEQIQPGGRVWQMAHVYGDLVSRAARKVGENGHFLLTDITGIQIAHARRKLAPYPWAQLVQCDAASWAPEKTYDLICSFFLLHEIPDARKRAVVDRALAGLAPNGAALFIDYHRPAWWQPAGWILRWVNAKLEPFAHSLWNTEIRDFATHADNYIWEKETLFGGVYQIVKARPK